MLGRGVGRVERGEDVRHRLLELLDDARAAADALLVVRNLPAEEDEPSAAATTAWAYPTGGASVAGLTSRCGVVTSPPRGLGGSGRAVTGSGGSAPERRAPGRLDPVDRDRDDQDRAGDDLLPETGDGGDREPVLQRPDEEDAHRRSGHTADPAEKAVPPSSTAAAASSGVLADEGLAAPRRPAWITPPMPAQSPAMA